ncbi:hypothetical protein E2C01_066739 [Portunus trituberculatus]|uniref:Uncharacterized protein n=1 Tax=Portunus trituberculatus TaxID=210409 RepID=A0A5B7HVH3_PORTR|nr:hypothetical protein [Portunus trituberculatus]
MRNGDSRYTPHLELTSLLLTMHAVNTHRRQLNGTLGQCEHPHSRLGLEGCGEARQAGMGTA